MVNRRGQIIRNELFNNPSKRLQSVDNQHYILLDEPVENDLKLDNFFTKLNNIEPYKS